MPTLCSPCHTWYLVNCHTSRRYKQAQNVNKRTTIVRIPLFVRRGARGDYNVNNNNVIVNEKKTYIIILYSIILYTLTTVRGSFPSVRLRSEPRSVLRASFCVCVPIFDVRWQVNRRNTPEKNVPIIIIINTPRGILHTSLSVIIK